MTVQRTDKLIMEIEMRICKINVASQVYGAGGPSMDWNFSSTPTSSPSPSVMASSNVTTGLTLAGTLGGIAAGAATIATAPIAGTIAILGATAGGLAYAYNEAKSYADSNTGGGMPSLSSSDSAALHSNEGYGSTSSD